MYSQEARQSVLVILSECEESRFFNMFQDNSRIYPKI